ncbi:MAG: trehalose-phosphatase [Mycobacteriales bacterium]|nr:trehalose-phosphatase [Mycobacteriales bacterium]
MPGLDDHPAVRALRADRARALVALDFDGTLAPIVSDPATAAALPGIAEVLASLGTRVAIVTGRPADVAVSLGSLRGVPGLVVLGQYGAQRWEAGVLSTPEPHPGVVVASAALAGLPDGARLEDKGLAVVVHTRPAADPAGLLEQLRPRVEAVAAAAGLEVHPGRYVLELRAPGHDKASALRSLLADRPSALVVAGDDLGDVPLLTAAREWDGPSLTVCSGSDEGPSELRALADVVVDGPEGVLDLLRSL